MDCVLRNGKENQCSRDVVPAESTENRLGKSYNEGRSFN